MLTQSQQNLLRWLGGFPESLEKAWDVPRELSLPGLADAMGVVRSGLNAPLNVLEKDGYVTKRMAHVIGGGTRRRHVHHITPAGRAWLREHMNHNDRRPTTKQSSTEGPTSVAPSPSLVGRNEALAAVIRLLKEHHGLQIHGMSGIGKTAFGKALAATQEKARWATADAFSDAQSLAASWCPEVETWPSNADSTVELILHHAREGLLILDDFHAVPSRHAASAEFLLQALHKAGMDIVVLAKPPVESGVKWPVYQLDALDPSAAMSLLPDRIDEAKRLEIARALGGHPMALHLHQEGSALPEAGESVQSYIRTTVLSDIEGSTLRALDAMVLFPRPLSIHHLPHGDAIGELDDHALLRWSGKDERVEVQHVVRNVRRAMLSDVELEQLHDEAAAHWEVHGTTDEHQVLRMYHELASGHRPEDLEERVQTVLPTQHRTLAVILEGATALRDEDEELHFLAGQVALHRMELGHVRRHMNRLRDGDLHRRLGYGLALAEGDTGEAKALLETHLAVASPLEAAKLLLSSAVQSVEDRLFDEGIPTETVAVTGMLERIDLPDEPAIRTPLMVSMALIRHALALGQGELGGAETVRESLGALSHQADPLLQAMRLREDMSTGHLVGNALVDRIEAVATVQPTPFHGAMIRMSGVEHFVNLDDQQTALMLFNGLPRPTTGGGQGQAWHRYCARWWYARGHLLDNERRACLREAVNCFRKAGCHRAAESVIARLHRVL